jgi:hypothetical protein
MAGERTPLVLAFECELRGESTLDRDMRTSREGSVAADDLPDDLPDLPDLEAPGKHTKSFWRRTWPSKGDPERSHVLGVPVRWLLVVATIVSIIAIVLVTVGTTLPRKVVRVQTGAYDKDAPFIEVISSNFPDPSLFRINKTWHVYGTNSAAGIIDSKVHGQIKDFGAANVQLATSKNLLDWVVTEATQGPLKELGAWAAQDMMPAEADSTTEVHRADVWAPEILQRPDGKFVLYYSAVAVSGTVHCVGAAVSDEPTGPFEPEPSPIICPLDAGGAIDPGVITDDDGSIWLAYKIDGNYLGLGGECGNMIFPQKATPIFLQKMYSDGITPDGAPITILDRTPDDGPLVEAPVLARSDDGVYFLFFSSGCTFNNDYNVKYATSNSITGPYTRASAPLLQTGSWGLLAPGSPTVWKDDKKWLIGFHARLYTDAGGIRPLYIAGLKLVGTTAVLEAPV